MMLISVNNQNGQPIEIEETVSYSDKGDEYQYSGENKIGKDEKYTVEGWRNRNEPFVASNSIKKSSNIFSTNENIADQINAQI